MYLYYYTNVETMRNILCQANIYATNLLYMNDSEEYANGLKELSIILNKRYENQVNSMSDSRILIDEKKLQKELEKEVSVYSISFSEARDLLSQWSMYAGESGVSLKLEFANDETYMTYFEGSGDARKELLNDKKIHPEKVFYCTKDVMQEADYEKREAEIWNKIRTDENQNTTRDLEGNYAELWKKYTPYVKRVEFQAEREYRLVFDRIHILNGKETRIDYRNSGNVLKSYMDIQCKDGWPIHEIIVGPGFNQDAVYRSILFFLNNAALKVRSLDNDTFLKRCEEYFTVCGKVPETICKIWRKKKSELEGKKIEETYMLWNLVYEEMKEKIKEKDLVYYNKLKNTVLTSKGIILSKSRIPYIY